MFIFFIIFISFYFGFFFEYVSNFVTNIFEQITKLFPKINLTYINLYSNLLIFYILINILIFIFPTKNFETKKELFSKIFRIFLIVITLIICFEYFTSPTNSTIGNLKNMKNQIKNNFNTGLNAIYCNIGSQKCIKNNGEKIENSQNVILDVYYKKHKINKFSNQELKDFNLNFYIQNKNIKVYLQEIKCYLNNEQSILIDQKNLENKFIKNQNKARIIDDLTCDLTKLNTQNQKTFKIVPKLDFYIKNQIKIPVLIINLDSFINVEKLKEHEILEKKEEILKNMKKKYGKNFLEAKKIDTIIENSFEFNTKESQVFFYSKHFENKKYKLILTFNQNQKNNFKNKFKQEKININLDDIKIPKIFEIEKPIIKNQNGISQIIIYLKLNLEQILSNQILENIFIESDIYLSSKTSFEILIENLEEEKNNQKENNLEENNSENVQENNPENQNQNQKINKNFPLELKKTSENRYEYQSEDGETYIYSFDKYQNWYYKPQDYPCQTPIFENQIKKCSYLEQKQINQNQLKIIEKIREYLKNK